MYPNIPQERCTKKWAQDFALKMLVAKNKATRGTEVTLLNAPSHPNTLMFRPVRKRANSPDCLDVSTPKNKKSKPMWETFSDEEEIGTSQGVVIGVE